MLPGVLSDFGVASAGVRPGRLDVIDVRRDRLQRAPPGAGDVGEVGRSPVGGRDRLPHALGVADGASSLTGVDLDGERDEVGEEPLELGSAGCGLS